MTRQKMVAAIAAAAALLAWLPPGSAQAQSKYVTSWVGNTYGGANRTSGFHNQHVPQNIDDLYMDSSGSITTMSPYEEGGRALTRYDKTGSEIGVTDPLANYRGPAIGSDGTYLYQGGKGPLPDNTTIPGLIRLNPDGTPTGWQALVNIRITGITGGGGTLYACDPANNAVHVFSGGSEIRTLSISSPARAVLDGSGSLWVIHRAGPSSGGATIDCYNPSDTSGAILRSITLPSGGAAAAMTVDGQGRLLVCDNGPDMNVKIYTNITSSPTLSGTFGTQGGFMAGPVPGAAGPLRFSQMTAIAVDGSGNIVIAQNGLGPEFAESGGGLGRGLILESYSASGSRNWVKYGLMFVSMASADPGSETDVYTGYHHFVLDYSQPAGQEWQLKGFTYDPFHFPADPRNAHIKPNGDIATTAFVKRINGTRFLYLSNQGGQTLTIYRFDSAHGEIAIPCGNLDYGVYNISGTYYSDLPNEPVPGGTTSGGEYIWRDTNGDGYSDASEFSQPVNAAHIDAQYWWIADNGDIWQARGESVTGGSGACIGHYVYQGLDSNGSPIYDYSHRSLDVLPTEFTQVDRITTSGDTVYILGNDSALLGRYDNWSTGNRKATWTKAIPRSGAGYQSIKAEGMTEAGNYIFLSCTGPNGQVGIYRTGDGSMENALLPGPEVGGGNAIGLMDEPMCCSAFLRSNGEYLIFTEEDYQQKVLMYRWRPGEAPPTTYEAESIGNALTGGVSQGNDPAYSAGQFVGGFGNGGADLMNNIWEPSAGVYNVALYYANPNSSAGSMQVTPNGGSPITVTLLATGGSVSSVTVQVPLNAEFNTILLSNGTVNVSIDKLEITPTVAAVVEAAYNGPHNLPGTVQSEDYDTGGEGVAYHDTDAGNNGGQYRSDDVDIEACADTGGGYDVGWTNSGEYLKYTVNAAAAGTYTVSFRVAAPSSGSTFHLSDASGNNLSGAVSVPATGGWQTWATVTATVTLPAGSQILTLNEDSSGFNINSMTFASAVASTATVYEAESGTLAGTASVYSDAARSGGKLVGNFQPGASDTISGVDGGAGGTASLVITYSANTGQRASLYVNGVFVQKINWAGGTYGNWRDQAAISITLNAGTSNTVKVSQNSDDSGAYVCADLDKLTVTPSSSGSTTPAAPSGLSATTNSSAAAAQAAKASSKAGSLATTAAPPVALSWKASARSVSYSVYRGTSSGGESSTALASGLTGTGYTDTSVASGTTYYYKVKAVNARGSSGYSNEASAKPAAALVTVYEAESGTLAGTASVYANAACSGGKLVGNLQVGASDTISGVNGGSGGTASLVISYLAANGKRASLYVNGVFVQKINWAGGTYGTPRSQAAISVTLKAGKTNTIKVSQDAGDSGAYVCADLDKLTVTTH